MGRYKFRFSDMIPNAWFYKLKDMGTRNGKSTTIPKPTKKTTTRLPTTPKVFPPPPPSPVKHNINTGRASYYIPRTEEKSSDSPFHPKGSDTKFLVDPPRKSKKKSRKIAGSKPSTKLVRSSVSSNCSCRATLGSTWKSEYMPEYTPLPGSPVPDDDDVYGFPCSDKPVIAEHLECHGVRSRSSSSCSSRITSSPMDNTMDFSSKSSTDVTGEMDLPPILTKPAKDVDFCSKLEPNANRAKQQKSPWRKSSEGIRMRGNSPRLTSKMIQRNRKGSTLTPRKGLSGSFAVVKASSDPWRDFKESMVEMIVENNIRTSKNLEDLLACYLSLNSREYHDVIVKVFEQIWFDLTTNVTL